MQMRFGFNWPGAANADPRRFAPSAQRNRDPILEVILPELPKRGTVLEIGSGSGEHAVYFASRLAEIDWVPSDRHPEALASIKAWSDIERHPNLWPPLFLDATQDFWPIQSAQAVLNINMVHIAPWNACEGLMRGTARILDPGGFLYLYGPYKVNGQHLSASTAEFDEQLRTHDPRWGVREVDEVAAEAAKHGFELVRQVHMPAHNLSLLFRRRAGR
jgi:SAM-dependent methyltransferase